MNRKAARRTGQLSLAFLSPHSPSSSLGKEAARRKSVTKDAKVLPKVTVSSAPYSPQGPMAWPPEKTAHQTALRVHTQIIWSLKVTSVFSYQTHRNTHLAELPKKLRKATFSMCVVTFSLRVLPGSLKLSGHISQCAPNSWSSLKLTGFLREDFVPGR